MKRIILAIAACVAIPASAAILNNPGVTWSTSPGVGNCVQATGANQIGTTSGPCGSGGTGGNVTGPSSSTVNHLVAFNNATGTSILDTGLLYTNIPTLSGPNAFTGANTFTQALTLNSTLSTGGAITAANGLSVPGGTPSIIAQNTPNTAAVMLLPDLAGAQYNPLALAGDAALIDGTANNTNFGLVIGLWGTTTPTGFRIGANGVNFGQRPTFVGATPWDSANFNPANYLPLTGGTLSNGATGNSTTADLTATNANASNQIAFYPALTAAAYNNTVQAGDAAIVFGPNPGAGNPGTGTLTIAPWSNAGFGGIRITPSGNQLFQPTTFENNATIADYEQLNTPVVNLAGAPPSADVVTGIYVGSNEILYPVNTDTWVAAQAGGQLHLVAKPGGPGAYIDTVGVLHDNAGITIAGVSNLAALNAAQTILSSLTVTGAASLGSGSTTVTQTAGDNTTAIATDAFVQTAVANAGQNPTFGNVTAGTLTVTGQLKSTNGPVQFSTPIQIPSITTSGSAPSAAIGTGAGTGGAATAIGTAMSGQISVSTGSNPGAGGVLATLTFTNVSYAATPYCVVSAASQNTSYIYSQPNLSGTTLSLTLGLANNEQLAPNASYTWNWWCP
jgi:hypothetical protein